MTPTARTRRRRPRWSGGAAAVLLSAAIHVGALTALLRTEPLARPDPPPVVEVTLLGPTRDPPTRPPEAPATRPTPAPAEDDAPALRPETPTRPGRLRPFPAGPGSDAFPAAPLPDSPAAPAREPAPARPAPAAPVPPGLGPALRASACDPFSRDAAERERCRTRVDAARGSNRLAISAAQAAAERGEEAARQGRKSAFEDAAVCGNPAGCAPHSGIRFGHVPPALPVIAPSTLRGDDDALRPKRQP